MCAVSGIFGKRHAYVMTLIQPVETYMTVRVHGKHGVCVWQSSPKHVGASPSDDPGRGHREQRRPGGILQPLPVHTGGQLLLHVIIRYWFLLGSSLLLKRVCFERRPDVSIALLPVIHHI